MKKEKSSELAEIKALKVEKEITLTKTNTLKVGNEKYQSSHAITPPEKSWHSLLRFRFCKKGLPAGREFVSEIPIADCLCHVCRNGVPVD